MEAKILNVEGMSCEHCVKAVSNALLAIDGVEDVAVSLQDKTASFRYDSALVSLETISAAIIDEGYEVAS
jgi:copper chaperone